MCRAILRGLILTVGLLGVSSATAQDAKPATVNPLAAFELGEKAGALQRTVEQIAPGLEKLDAKRKEGWTKTRKAITDEVTTLKTKLKGESLDIKAATESLDRLERELTAWEGYAQLLAKDRPAAAAGPVFRDLPGLNGAVILHGDVVQLRAMELLEQMIKDPEAVKKTLQGLIPPPAAGQTGGLGKRLQDQWMKDIERIKKESDTPKKDPPKK